MRPYIMGVPHRLKYLDLALEHICGRDEAIFFTGEQILDWYTTSLCDRDRAPVTGTSR